MTYVRNATVFEDLIRNAVPFVNSYRQFALYWARAFALNPFAMTAFYQYNPIRGQMQTQYGDVQFFLPPVPFWTPQTPEDESAAGFIRNSFPNVNPFIALGAGAFLRGPAGVESEIEQVPGLGSTGRSWAPFGRFSSALAGEGIFLGFPTGPDGTGVNGRRDSIFVPHDRPASDRAVRHGARCLPARLP